MIHKLLIKTKKQQVNKTLQFKRDITIIDITYTASNISDPVISLPSYNKFLINL